MRTVIETPTFQKQADKIWSEDERLEFIEWIAQNPLAGDVIPNADGARKVRWSVKGQGKRGSVRVIYFNLGLSLIHTFMEYKACFVRHKPRFVLQCSESPIIVTTHPPCHILDLSGFKNPKGLCEGDVCHPTTASPLKDWQSLNKG